MTDQARCANAAGYVRVGEAEAALCLRANATGPAHLAAKCRRRGLPLITYLSDLVFDGTKGRCYDETDVPLPLNVYGASKAEAERAVLALLPQAPVIRTSAFFGPWDSHNFLAHLFAALHLGETLRAADDAIVSPAYVPDLVHASLDLLIDQQCGIWHLVNDGAMSWYAFAMLAAVKSGHRLDLITPTSAAALNGAAARPAFTALTSWRGQLLRPVDTALAAFFGEMHRHDVEAPPCASR